MTSMPELDRAMALRVVSILLVVAVVAPFGIFAVPQLAGGDASFVVVSGSMEPAISVGDAVVVGDVDGADVRVGDVITYVTADRSTPTTHRVIEVLETDAGREFVTQGDNNEDPDASTVTPDRLVGRVVLTLPYVGYVVGFVGSTAGFALLVVAPIVLLVGTELRGVVRRLREDDSEAGAAKNTANSTSGDGSARTSSAADEAPVADEPVAWSIGARDLTVTMAVVGVAAVYSGVLAYLVYDGSVTYLRLLQISASAFAAFAVAFAALLALRLVVEPSDGESVTGDSASGGVLRGTLDPATLALPTVTVDDDADLRAMAGAAGRWLVHDESTDLLSYTDGELLYVCAAPTADGSTAAGGATAGEDAAWTALFGDAVSGRGTSTDDARTDADARPDGGESDAN